MWVRLEQAVMPLLCQHISPGAECLPGWNAWAPGLLGPFPLPGQAGSAIALTLHEFPWWLRQWRICLQCRRPRFSPWVGKISWRKEWLPTPVLLPGESHGQRSLAGYIPWGCKESNMTERLPQVAQPCSSSPGSAHAGGISCIESFLIVSPIKSI